MKKEEFSKFVSFSLCSEEGFLKAKEYNDTLASPEEKNKFTMTCFFIVKLVIQEMAQNKTLDYHEFKEIYNAHGMSDAEFDVWYNCYVENVMNKKDKAQFVALCNKMGQENIWKEAKEALWDSAQIKRIANKYLITIDKTEVLIRNYFLEVLALDRMEMYEYKRLYKAFKLFLENKIQNEKDVDNAWLYYEKYADAIEKEAFKNRALQIFRDIEGFQGELNSYLDTNHLNLFQIYKFAGTFRKDLVRDIAKLFLPYYNYCKENDWKRLPLQSEAKKQNISYVNFKEMGKIYARVILGIESIEQVIARNYARPSVLREDKMNTILKIYESESLEESCSLIQSIKLTKADIYQFCYSYNRHLSSHVKEHMEIVLQRKLNDYYNTKKVKSGTKFSLEDIYEYLNSPMDIEQFCDMKHYSISGLRAFIKDKDLLLKFNKKIASDQANNAKQKENLVRSVLDYIKNGFVSGDEVYPFWLIDFFILFPSINFSGIRTGFLNKEEATIIGDFFAPAKNWTILSRNSILGAYITKEINYNGQVFMKSFTKEEIAEIVAFMDYYHIPFTDLLFHQACVRYAENTLSIYMNDNLALK